MGKGFASNRARLGSAALVVVLMLGGAGLIAVSLASQKSAPEIAATDAPTTRISSGASFSPFVAGEELPAPVAMNRSEPIELRIPSIGVISRLQHLGRDADGSLEVPAPGPLYNDAAWYRHSPTPGELGPSVLMGHVDSAADGPSVFFRLGDVQPGDRVMVRRADGSTARFTIESVRRYSKDDFPTGLVYGDIQHAGLRILTCGGAFDDSTGHYLDNIVVFASLTRV